VVVQPSSAANHLRVQKPRLRWTCHDNAGHARLVKALSQYVAVREDGCRPMLERFEGGTSIVACHFSPNRSRLHPGARERVCHRLCVRHVHTEYDGAPTARVPAIGTEYSVIAGFDVDGLRELG